MKIILTKVFVDDPERALKFYTETLGFVKKNDVSAEGYRWLTVVSPDDRNGTELLLELNDNPVVQAYQEGIFEQGIPAASFGVEDVRAEYERLKAQGVEFMVEPTDLLDQVTIAVFDDTCGNLIQIQTLQK
ncbi:MAG: VOC family protein [Methanoculleus sp.]|nr:VOC family protein [Methanoculleus sp.]